MTASGANVTPDKLAAAEMRPVEDASLAHLRQVIAILNPQFLIGVGAYAEQRLREAAPTSNRDWAGTARKQLIEAGVRESESSGKEVIPCPTTLMSSVS